ncbi:MAG TPA: hypothetical protein VHW02_07935 [Rhizomicrobium sp.]|jgi:lysozyme|nr:hypothetical protein [Rhizomicrobium sp.]
MFDRDKLISDLIGEEGERFVVYDDATGKQIGPGDTLQGHPTVGIGHALDLTPFTDAQARMICGWDIDAKTPAVYTQWPWLSTQTEPRQRGVADLAFNMGVQKLSAFTTFLSLLKAGKFDAASEDLAATAWAREVGPARTAHIQNLIRGTLAMRRNKGRHSSLSATVNLLNAEIRKLPEAYRPLVGGVLTLGQRHWKLVAYVAGLGCFLLGHFV